MRRGGCNRTVGRVRAVDFPELSLRRRGAIHRRVFPVRFPRPSAARRQGADSAQARGAVGIALSGEGRDLDGSPRPGSRRSSMPSGRSPHASSRHEKGPKRRCSDPFLVHRPRLTDRARLCQTPSRHQWSRSFFASSNGRGVVPAVAAVREVDRRGGKLASWSRHSDVPREPRGPRLGIGRSWQTPDSNPYSSFQSLLLSRR